MSHIMPLSQITYGIASIIYFSLFLALLYGALVASYESRVNGVALLLLVIVMFVD
jgi:hypothetical protein